MIQYGVLRAPGNYGYNWSRTALGYTNSTTAEAQDFYFNNASINTSNQNGRYVGFPIRCLAD